MKQSLALAEFKRIPSDNSVVCNCILTSAGDDAQVTKHVMRWCHGRHYPGLASVCIWFSLSQEPWPGGAVSTWVRGTLSLPCHCHGVI